MTPQDAALVQDAAEALQEATVIIQQLRDENTRWQENFNRVMAYAEALLETVRHLTAQSLASGGPES